MKTTFIYALCEPGTRTVRYIGKADNPSYRFKQHLRRSVRTKTHLGNWLHSLLSKGEKPDLAVLREVPEELWKVAEERYIRLARGLRINLVNSTDGGEGVTMTPETREKIGLTKRGKRPPDAVLAAASAATKGVPRSPETRAKISAKLKGKRPSDATLAAASSPEASAKRSATLKGVPKSPEHRANLRGPKSPEHCAAISRSKKGRPAHNFGKPRLKGSNEKQSVSMKASWARQKQRDQEIEWALAPYTLE